MRKILNYLIIVLIICLIIWGSFWLYENSLKTQPVQSASSDNVSGYAWSSNIGWISFNGSNYGVNIDANNGKLSGYAWSSNIGWISFNESDTGVPPSNNPCADDSCIAKATPSGNLGKSDVPIYGWARALNYGDGWDGWVRFDHGQANEVYIDANGEFHGWAWGGDVIGWISFNCADASASYPFTCGSEGGDICQANEYCPGEIWDVTDTDKCCSATCAIIIEETLEDCLDDCREAFSLCRTGCKWWEEECIEDCLEEKFICRTDCANLYCGNCVIDSGEQCDDCNAINTDAWLNTCVNATCGDGYVRSGVEQCDDGNTSNTDACLNTCVNAICGDGYVRSGVEQCDDGNNINGDGCSAVCTIEAAPEPKPEPEPREPRQR